MTQREISQRSEKLQALIEGLSKSQDVLKEKKSQNDYYMKLKGIYITKTGESFRHFYNEIFSVITEIHNQEPEAIDVLGENMRILYKYCMERDEDQIKEPIAKLFDHVSLDIARIKYTNAIDRRLELTGDTLLTQISDVNKKIEEAKNTYDGIKDDVEDTSKKINNAYSEFVSILGIFSAIVLVFFGGTSIIGNVIGSMKETNIFITLIVTCFAGTIIFDILFMFIYFLAKLIDRNIATTAEELWWESTNIRMKNRYPIIFYANIISIIIIYVACLAGTIQWIVKNQYEVINWLNNNLQIDFVQQSLLFYITLVLVLYNITFIFAYILSKITDINIGRIISIKYNKDYSIENDGSSYMIVVDYDYEKAKRIRYISIAYIYITTCKVFSFVRNEIHNIVSRVVLRYPYWFVTNILLIGAWININDNI